MTGSGVRIPLAAPAFARFASYGSASQLGAVAFNNFGIAKRAKVAAPKPVGRRRAGAAVVALSRLDFSRHLHDARVTTNGLACQSCAPRLPLHMHCALCPASAMLRAWSCSH